jgi:uncharacterized protein YjiK
MLVKQKIILLILFLVSLTGCSQDNNTYTLFEKPNYAFPYQLDEPDKSWKLPKTLVEISGLSFIDNYRLAGVQDEKGVVYIFNLKAGGVELEIDFGDNGDYEGIEIIENDAWVLKSNGTLYMVKDYLEKAGPNVKKYTTALSGKNDAEGLAYDPVNKNLLIACKEDPFVDEKEGSGFKAIYSFNLETKLIDLKPFFLINLDSIKYYKGDAAFKPSGIAIQPVTGDIFILGSVGKLLLVLTGKGEMLAMIKLRPKIFPQPEGICFSPDGTLYISNEGGGKEGTLLQFEPRK